VAILTPDQRLRVFVSSTLRELAPERDATRRAITNLRMTPIMFELGARPHPPRDLYRAYLEQSQIFIGIYAASYGWIAPGMEISGLEDEYLLSGDRPKLVYLKNVPEREPRLNEMIKRIQADDVSYKPFGTPDELERLIADDLALLLTERFQSARPHVTVHEVRHEEPKATTDGAHGHRLPAQLTTFVGRSAERAALRDLLQREDVRLITLSGPGGIGKTRLSIEVARGLDDAFSDGVWFVPLAALRDPNLVASEIVDALKIKDPAPTTQASQLKEYLKDREALIVLDNFEQLVPAASLVAELLEAASRVKFLITSREVLRLRGELEFEVTALEVPTEEEPFEKLESFDAIRLFMERAQTVRPNLELTPENAPTIAEICARLDGLPLALELAAAWLKVLSPQQLLKRLEGRFELAAAGPRDMPERQRTLRDTIEWSFDLLAEDEQKAFVRLGVFEGTFTFLAAEYVCDPKGEIDMLEVLSSLVDKSLIRPQEDEDLARFTMLRVVREYALDRLKETDELEETQARHGEYFFRVSQDAYYALRRVGQHIIMEGLERDLDNLRRSIEWLKANDGWDRLAHVGWALWIYWWTRGHLEEGRKLMEEVLTHDLHPIERGRALGSAGILAVWQADYNAAVPWMYEAVQVFRAENDKHGLANALLGMSLIISFLEGDEKAKELIDEAIQLHEEENDEWGLAAALNVLCWLHIALEDYTSREDFDRASMMAHRVGDELGIAMSKSNMAEYKIHHGEFEEAKDLLRQALPLFRELRMRDSTAFALETVAKISAREEKLDIAARLLGAAENLRESVGVPIWGTARARHEAAIARLKSQMGDESFDGAWSEGRVLSFDDAIDWALAFVASVTTTASSS
jgi:predicted ATPase